MTLAGASFGIDVPSGTLLAGYGLGLLTIGTNNIPAKISLTLLGSNTDEGSLTYSSTNNPGVDGIFGDDPLTVGVDESLDDSVDPGTAGHAISVIGTTVISDPSPTNKTSGDETATPLSVTATLPTTTWTPSGGDISFSLGDSSTSAIVAGGAITVTFACTPGTATPAGCAAVGSTVDCTGTDPQPADAFDVVTVITPPTSPTAVDDAASVGATQSIVIDVLDNDSDPNDDIDPLSVTITTPPIGGSAVPNPDGTITYTNTDSSLTEDTFGYTVNDLDGTTAASNEATVTVAVLGDFCTAPCSLSQIIVTPVIGATMTLEQAGLADDFIVPMISASSIAGDDGIPGTPDDTLEDAAPIILNGQPQLAVGQMYEMTVTNARGDDAVWDLTAQTTAFTDGTILGNDCSASDESTWNSHCIPGDNLGWVPSSEVAHTQVIGDVAAVSSGSPLFSPGFLLSTPTPLAPTGLGSSAQELCSAGLGTSGGTFHCNASLMLAVPASAAAGQYTGLLTLTLA